MLGMGTGREHADLRAFQDPGRDCEMGKEEVPDPNQTYTGESKHRQVLTGIFVSHYPVLGHRSRVD